MIRSSVRLSLFALSLIAIAAMAGAADPPEKAECVQIEVAIEQIIDNRSYELSIDKKLRRNTAHSMGGFLKPFIR